jgi:hypothetical protein
MATSVCNKKIKLIWDFWGSGAEKTAAHHCLHLKGFLTEEGLADKPAGTERVADTHWIAWMVVSESEVPGLRATLRPQRGLEA